MAENLSPYTRGGDFPSRKAAIYDSLADPIGVDFENGYAEPLGNAVAARAPFAMAAEADLPGLAEGKTLEIDGTIYVIRNFEPDGVGGMVLLRLEEQLGG